MPVAAPRGRADGDEDGVRFGDRVGQIGREGEAAAPHVALDETVEPGLEDRHDAAVERLDLARVLVDADDVVSEVGEAGAGYEPDIARPDHDNTH